jgi:thymidylate synthase
MQSYLNLVQHILDNGAVKENRTGVDAITVAGAMFEHDMAEGFPLLTTKTIPFRLIASELEFFIRGYTDKKWLQDRNNHIWDDWARQDKIPYGHDEETLAKMKAERDLGPIYGWQWRHFGADYPEPVENQTEIGIPLNCGVDQLWDVSQTLKKNPGDRRMIVSAWNPIDIPKMGLPPCHFCFQVTVINGKLNLLWSQRSVDTMIGLPFNIAGYALLLHLLAKDSGLEEGRLVGFLADTHIYVNHMPGVEEQLKRTPYPLPKVMTPRFTTMFEWKHDDSALQNYEHHPKIPFEIAV